jgi:hypothetical protein
MGKIKEKVIMGREEPALWKNEKAMNTKRRVVDPD